MNVRRRKVLQYSATACKQRVKMFTCQLLRSYKVQVYRLNTMMPYIQANHYSTKYCYMKYIYIYIYLDMYTDIMHFRVLNINYSTHSYRNYG